ncbi:MAG: glycosyltransferase [Clostridia bacterium]|nr:glycosyltransferase [Clostridia bacterium]
MKCNKWESGCYECSKLNEYPKSLIDNSKRNYELKKKMFTSVKELTLVPVSNWIEQEIKKSYLKSFKTVIINNGIDLNVFKPAESDMRKRYNIEDKKVLLAVADRWTERKGFTDFIQLSQMLDENTKLIMVGLSEEQKTQLPTNIIGITRTENQKQLSEIYSTADLFVNFTYSDNFPTVNLESLACGTPVLTYRTGGSPEMLTDKTGYVIEQGDVDKALEIINKFVKTKEIESACIKHAQNYDKNLQFVKYEELYKTDFKREDK